MSLLDVSQWPCAYAFMRLWWRRFWDGQRTVLGWMCQKKVSVLCREAHSKPWKDATDEEAGWDEGKDPQVSPGGQQDLFPFGLSEGGGMLVKK